MGKKLDLALERLNNEARHHTKLALTKQTDFENGFAQGFTEAVRILEGIRNVKQ